MGLGMGVGTGTGMAWKGSQTESAEARRKPLAQTNRGVRGEARRILRWETEPLGAEPSNLQLARPKLPLRKLFTGLYRG